MYGNPGYNQSGYGYMPPMAPTQTRLSQMESQYPQYSQGYGSTPGGMIGSTMAPQGAGMGLLKGRVVSSLDEVKGAMIDLDGSVHVFTDLGNHKIYTKQVNLDGTATLNTYSLDNTPPPAQEPPVVNRDEFNQLAKALSDKIQGLENQIKEMSVNVQSDGNDGDAPGNGPRGSKPGKNA